MGERVLLAAADQNPGEELWWGLEDKLRVPTMMHCENHEAMNYQSLEDNLAKTSARWS